MRDRTVRGLGMRRAGVAATFVLLLLFGGVSAHPCSIFSCRTEAGAFFCGNEDWTATDPVFQTHPAAGSSYGYVAFGWASYMPSYVQAGINSEGLCFDWAVVPSQSFVAAPGKKKLGSDATIDILKTCATVDEALAFIERYNFPNLASEHLFLADRKGASCVVEYNHGKVRVVKGGAYLAATNFHLSDTALGWYPCERYEKIDRGLSGETGKLLPRDLVRLLDAAHQEGEYPTIYSYVFDLTRLRMTVFHKHDFSKGAEYAVADLLASERTVRISAR
jgi:hypothetical protein